MSTLEKTFFWILVVLLGFGLCLDAYLVFLAWRYASLVYP